MELVNPYFKELTREIEIKTGETVELREKLALDSSGVERKEAP